MVSGHKNECEGPSSSFGLKISRVISRECHVTFEVNKPRKFGVELAHVSANFGFGNFS